jgi:cell shape-determining protein MreD
MLETPGASIPPSSPQNTNPWIIVILVIVILCCFCVGAIGLLFAFGGPILNELGLLHALLPTLIS